MSTDNLLTDQAEAGSLEAQIRHIENWQDLHVTSPEMQTAILATLRSVKDFLRDRDSAVDAEKKALAERDALLTQLEAMREALEEARTMRNAAIKLLEPGKLGRVMEASKYSPHWSSYAVDRMAEIAAVDQARRELLGAVYPSDGSLIDAALQKERT